MAPEDKWRIAKEDWDGLKEKVEDTHTSVVGLIAEWKPYRKQVDRNRDAIEGKRGLNANIRLLLWGGGALATLIIAIASGVIVWGVSVVMGMN